MIENNETPTNEVDKTTELLNAVSAGSVPEDLKNFLKSLEENKAFRESEKNDVDPEFSDAELNFDDSEIDVSDEAVYTGGGFDEDDSLEDDSTSTSAPIIEETENVSVDDLDNMF